MDEAVVADVEADVRDASARSAENTMSPGWSSLRLTATPIFACSADVRGRLICMVLRKMCCMKPLQSKPLLTDDPPKR